MQSNESVTESVCEKTKTPPLHPISSPVPSCPVDLPALLKNCGGRITKVDAQMLWDTALGIEAKNIVEIGSADG